MLTIFGKKKKDETDGDKPAEATTPPAIMPSRTSQNVSPSGVQNSSASPQPAPSNLIQPAPSPVARAPPPQPMMRPIPPGAPFPEEETSLVRLLRSLVQDIPIPADTSSNSIPESTPDYVPLRSTPPSRPMMIGGGKDSGEWEGAEEESPGKLIPAGPSIKPSKPVETPPPTGKTPIPSPILPKPVEKAPEKPLKIDKPPEKPAPPKKATRAPQSFDHIFQLTQGNLENAGLVIVNGVPGSGRTTLCSGLTANYMKMGNPCLYLTYDQPPSELRDQMKKLGTDAAQYESQFRFIVIDGFTSQSDSFSMEPYYLDQPFSFDNIQDALVRNSGIFAGEKIRVIFDSMDKLVAKVPQKDFAKGFGDLAGKLKDAGATFIVTVDMSALPKDLVGTLSDMADCVVDLSKDDSDSNGRQLLVQRLNQKASKIDPETFEIDSSKGLVFV